MMFLNRKKKGYGWYTVVNTDKKGDKVADNETGYIDFYFARDCEPNLGELNEHGSYQCELIMRDTTGAERKVFPYIDGYFHTVVFKVLGKTNEFVDEHPSYLPPKTEPKWDWQSTLDGKPDENYYKNATKFSADEVPTEIQDDDLPFL